MKLLSNNTTWKKTKIATNGKIVAKYIKINDIKNSIQTGPLVGNRNVGFGLKNILEEVVQDQDYNLNDKSKNIIQKVQFDRKH